MKNHFQGGLWVKFQFLVVSIIVTEGNLTLFPNNPNTKFKMLYLTYTPYLMSWPHPFYLQDCPILMSTYNREDNIDWTPNKDNIWDGWRTPC